MSARVPGGTVFCGRLEIRLSAMGWCYTGLGEQVQKNSQNDCVWLSMTDRDRDGQMMAESVFGASQEPPAWARPQLGVQAPAGLLPHVPGFHPGQPVDDAARKTEKQRLQNDDGGR